MIESGKDVATFGVTDILLAFGDKELFELGEIRSLELRAQHFEPRGIYLGVYHWERVLEIERHADTPHDG